MYGLSDGSGVQAGISSPAGKSRGTLPVAGEPRPVVDALAGRVDLFPTSAHVGLKNADINQKLTKPHPSPEVCMNQALEQLASETGLLAPENETLRLAFAHACVIRIRHLLEEPEVIECLDVLGRYLDGRASREALEHSQREADRLANQHRGSKSIDGCGHAAVSASYAVANAINGKALQAASYAAYATVYADGGYGAVSEREAFEPENSWQVAALRDMAGRTLARA